MDRVPLRTTCHYCEAQGRWAGQISTAPDPANRPMRRDLLTINNLRSPKCGASRGTQGRKTTVPMRPPHPCAHPGCGRLVAAKETCCQAHQRQRWRAESAHRIRKGGRAWRRLRDRKLRTNPICQICETKLAVEVDHIEPVAKAPEREFDWANLQSACHDCHVAKTAEDLRG